MTNPADIVAKLQKDANTAAEFSSYIGLLRESASVMEETFKTYLPDVAAGEQYRTCIAYAASLHIRFRLALDTGMPPNPAMTKEGFLQMAGGVFDSLDSYYTVQKQEEDENGKA